MSSRSWDKPSSTVNMVVIAFNYGGGVVGVCPVSLFAIIQIPDRFVNIFVDKDFCYHFPGIGKKVNAWKTFGLRCSIG